MLKVFKRKLGNTTALCLKGRLVAGETTSLVEATASDNIDIVLDLARVSRIDAHGLGVLLELREQTASKGGRFILVNVTTLVRKVLEISRLDTVFEIVAERELAKASVQTGQTEILEGACCA